jgi:hypothetical protein
MPLSDSSNLRNQITFPPFESLPHENDIDDIYFQEDPLAFVSRPRRHWCFLGEIVDMMILGRLRLEVKDKNGHVLPVNFHTDDCGAAFTSQCKKGHTLAILYGQQHAFMDMTVGIRLEDSGSVKVLPFSLQQVLEVNDLLFEGDRKDKCDFCGAKEKDTKGGLKQCSSCKMSAYCGKVSFISALSCICVPDN